MYAKFDKYVTLRGVFIFGLVLAVVISALEISRGRCYNYEIFARGVQELWQGLNPYVGFMDRHVYEGMPERHLDNFIYLPAFGLPFVFALLPWWLGAFVWNVFNFVCFCAAVRLLPGLTARRQRLVLLFALPLMCQNLFSFQYNITVVNLFLFAFVLLERQRYWWALLLVAFTAVTKIYGLVIFGMVLFYPQFWRNVGRSVVCLVLLALSPMIFGGWEHMVTLYGDWYAALVRHEVRSYFDTVSRVAHLYLGIDLLQQYGQAVLCLVALAIAALAIWRRKVVCTLDKRYQMLGILIVLPVLWGNNTEPVTFLLPVVGYLLWYTHTENLAWWDEVVFWCMLVFLCLLPIDIVCPRSVYHILIYNLETDTGLSLNVITLLAAWLRMVQTTMFTSSPCPSPKSENEG